MRHHFYYCAYWRYAKFYWKLKLLFTKSTRCIVDIYFIAERILLFRDDELFKIEIATPFLLQYVVRLRRRCAHLILFIKSTAVSIFYIISILQMRLHAHPKWNVLNFHGLSTWLRNTKRNEMKLKGIKEDSCVFNKYPCFSFYQCRYSPIHRRRLYQSEIRQIISDYFQYVQIPFVVQQRWLLL